MDSVVMMFKPWVWLKAKCARIKQAFLGFWPLYVRIFAYTRPYRSIFMLGVLLTALSGAMDGAVVWLLKPIIDHGFVTRNAAFITWLPLMIIVLGVSRALFAGGSRYCVARTGLGVTTDFRTTLYGKYLYLPMAFYENERLGRMISIFSNNIGGLAYTATTLITTGIRECAALLGILGVMFSLSWPLASLFLLSAPFVVMIAKYSGKRLHKLNLLQQETMADTTHLLEESLGAVGVVRSSNAQTYQAHRMDGLLKKSAWRQLKCLLTDAFGMFGIQTLVTLPLALCLYLVTSSIMSISAGTFTALVSAMLSLKTPLQRLSGMNNSLQAGMAAAQSVFEVLDLSSEIDEGSQSLDERSCQGHIVVDDVCFRYGENATDVLSHVKFTVKPGETVALVGASGAGKSTIMKLLQRFYAPQSGCIQLDGVAISDYCLQDFRKQFAIVNQDVILFNASVRDNIAYAQSDVTDDAVVEAAKLANAWDFVRQLPHGLDTLIGPRGIKLSGGQKQRIAIARAVFLKRPILLLDEATSSLDSQSERLVQDALSKLMVNMTAIVIAHRLSTIQRADCILVLQDGCIIERGRHHELLQKGGAYANLHQLQSYTSEPESESTAT